MFLYSVFVKINNMLGLLFVLFYATSILGAPNVRDQTNLQGPSSAACVLPSYPEHGGYSVDDVSIAAPGQHYNTAFLNFVCNPGFEVQGEDFVFCVNGTWSDNLPTCRRSGGNGIVNENSGSKTEASGFQSNSTSILGASNVRDQTKLQGPSSAACVLPSYPEHGGYSVDDVSIAAPGQHYNTAFLNFACNPGFEVQGEDFVFCVNGIWSHDLPSCRRSGGIGVVNENSGSKTKASGFQSNSTLFVRATNVRDQINLRGRSSAACVLPSYPEQGGYSVVDESIAAPGEHYNSVILNFACNPGFEVQGQSFVFCVNGIWSDDLPRCRRSGGIGVVNENSGSKTEASGFQSNYTDCGTVTAPGEQLQPGVTYARHGTVPWHVDVYSKQEMPYSQICGGSLVTRTAVITAAHNFWMKPASDYAVAVGKIYRSWNDPMDVNVQKSDVSDIKLPARFQGLEANFQDDIAIVILTTPVQYNTFVKPVCLDFDFAFDRKQLQIGSLAKVTSWGLTANQHTQQALRVVEIPYVDVEQCLTGSPAAFREYITSDKICAGFGNGTAVCRGDSGSGLVFPEHYGGTVRYYLRGVLSNSPIDSRYWCSAAYSSFTKITKHEQFINDNLF